ncbi:iron-containing alcohol dehydrogenase [Alphaproteobacteria bacterium HT1-32]|nr:iron-containing alcohol dehydrogenase [Alphaproteobacteria bacterium HT1-32]|tara:strand:- start:11820 stop:13124 length:1305 start_codon:yes stop_codon:yes gene_type:complete
MACCHHYIETASGDAGFTIDMSRITFGRGVMSELGDRAKALGMTRIGLFTDPRLKALEPVTRALESIRKAGLDVDVYDEILVEPDSVSVMKAAKWVEEGNFDGFVSVGGGSVMDTAKAAIAYGVYPVDFMTYVIKPLGGGATLPGPLPPHIACPTTAGTGSETTPISVVYVQGLDFKLPVVHRQMLPTEAIVDPTCTYSLPTTVIACSAFDLISHALEAFTARPHTVRPAPDRPTLRPTTQGANLFSDIIGREALKLAGEYAVRAVADARDIEARDNISWAATLAGIAFANTGTHAPHAMSYPVSALNCEYHASGYADTHKIVPHGMAVIINAPSVFRFTADACPERHLSAAEWLGADIRGAGCEDAGEVIAKRLIWMMQQTGMPNGIGGVGMTRERAPELAKMCLHQPAINNSPKPIDLESLTGLYSNAVSYW